MLFKLLEHLVSKFSIATQNGYKRSELASTLNKAGKLITSRMRLQFEYQKDF
jgi:hypothetical protein